MEILRNVLLFITLGAFIWSALGIRETNGGRVSDTVVFCISLAALCTVKWF